MNVTEPVAPVVTVAVRVTSAENGEGFGEDASVVVDVWPLTVKLVALAAFASGVTTLTGPVVAPSGTVAVIEMAEFTVNVAAAIPLKRTAITPRRFVPLMVTRVPAGPLDGVNPLICGRATKLAALLVVPEGVVTLILPVVALKGTDAVIDVVPFTANELVTPLKRTALTSTNTEPVMSTRVPAVPCAGEKPLIAGAGTIVAAACPVAEQPDPGVVTVTLSSTVPDVPAVKLSVLVP